MNEQPGVQQLLREPVFLLTFLSYQLFGFGVGETSSPMKAEQVTGCHNGHGVPVLLGSFVVFFPWLCFLGFCLCVCAYVLLGLLPCCQMYAKQ